MSFLIYITVFFPPHFKLQYLWNKAIKVTSKLYKGTWRLIAFHLED